MAIVGTAFVRLRVIGDKLSGDIAKATKKAVQDSAPDLTEAGAGAGEHVGEGMGEGVEKTARQQMDAIGDQIGDALGTAMGQSLGRSLRRRVGDSFKTGFQGVESKLAPIKAKIQPVFEKFGDDWGKATSGKFTGIFKKALMPGIGLIATALPSALAFAGAGIGALAATAVTALSAIGPAVAGAGIAGIAAFSAIKISAGLVGLALKQQTPQLDDYKERLDAFKTTIATPIQAGLLSGLNASMRLLGPVITSIQPQLTQLGIAVGDVAIGFADALRQGEMMARIQTILDTNNRFITTAGTGVSSLGQAFIILLSHLAPVTDFLGTLVQDIGDWVLRAALAGEATGTLDSFITRMFDSLRYFVGILVDFGIGIWNVFKAAHGASDGMLTTLHDNAQAFRDWTGDPANQERMTNFFERMRIIAGQVLSVLKDIAGAALGALDSTSVERFTGAMDTLRSLGAPIAAMFSQIQDAAGPQLQVAFENFAQMIIDLANSGVIGILAQALSNLFAIISTILQIPGIGALLSFGAGLLVIFKTVSLLWTILGPVVKILFSVGRLLFQLGGILISTFGIIPVLIAAVVAGLIYFFAFTDTGRAIVMAAVHAIVAAFEWCRDAVVAAFNWVVNALGVAWAWIVSTAQSLGATLSGVWNTVVGAVTTAWNAVIGAVQTALTAVWNVITGVWNAVVGFITPILTGIWTVIQTIFSAIVTVVTTYLNILWAIWSGIFSLLMLPIRIFYGLVILLFQLMLDGIMVIINLLWAGITTVWNAIWAVVSTVVTAIWNTVVTVWNAISGAVQAAMDWIWNIISTAWNAVYAVVSSYLLVISTYISNVWNGITSAVGAAMDAVWNVISSIWNTVSGYISGVLNTISSAISSVWNTISGYVSGAMTSVKTTITNVWNDITGFLQGAMDTISGIVGGVWDTLSGAGDSVVSGLKSAVNGMIDIINGAIGGINNMIDIANQLPGPDIPTIRTIPKLAKGGVVSPVAGGTLALIAEAGRSERVEPLDSQGLSARDRAIIAQLAGSGGGGSNVTVLIGTRELTELVDFVVEDREDRLADRVVTGTKG